MKASKEHCKTMCLKPSAAGDFPRGLKPSGRTTSRFWKASLSSPLKKHITLVDGRRPSAQTSKLYEISDKFL